jgi:hypothetical protein
VASDEVVCSACGQVLRSTGKQRFSLGPWQKWVGGVLVAVGLPGSLLAGFLVVRGLVEGTVASAFGLEGGAALGVGFGVGFVSVCFLLIGASLLRPDAELAHDVGDRVTCPSCGQRTAPDTGWCQWCDQPLGSEG